MKFHSFFISLLCVVFFAACDKEEIYPTFSFDENGECYIPDISNISMEEFKSSVVGYGWKHVITHEIGSDGKCSTKDYYEGLDGGGSSQYYFESSESLKEYMYVDAFPANGYLTYAYEYEDGNRVSNNGNLVMRMCGWSKNLRVLHIQTYEQWRTDRSTECLSYRSIEY